MNILDFTILKESINRLTIKHLKVFTQKLHKNFEV